MRIRSLIQASAATIALFAANPAFADGHGDHAAAAAPTAEAPAEAAGPALWKVADEDTIIYLFGTVHMLPETVEWNSGAVNDALASAEMLVTELDMTPEKEAEITALFEAEGMLPEGQTLRGLMSEEQLAAYETGLAKVGFPAEILDPMEPWLASIFLLQVLSQAAGFTPDRGVETVLESAIGPDVQRAALETIEMQLQVFDELPIDQQLTYLLEGAEDPAAGVQVLNTLVAEWAEGDADAVGKMMNEGLADHPNLADRLLYSRNKNWAEWIDQRLDSPGTVFVAVGAGHLAGPKSVQDYLTERGIMTERVQ